MPIVTIFPRAPEAAVWMASRTAAWKTLSGEMTWSAANEPMIVSGLRR